MKWDEVIAGDEQHRPNKLLSSIDTNEFTDAYEVVRFRLLKVEYSNYFLKMVLELCTDALGRQPYAHFRLKL